MPLHVPVVVESVAPSVDEPETTGSPVLTGAVIPVTTAVGADWALADPSPFVAVSSTRRVRADVGGL